MAWGLGRLRLGPGDGRAEALRRREGWEAGDRWALLDRQGRVLASDIQAPQGEALVQVLEANGLPSLKSRLERFLRQHPGHGWAWMALLELESQRIWAELQPRLKPPQAGQPQELRSSLTEVESEALFGPLVGVLEQVVRHGA